MGEGMVEGGKKEWDGRKGKKEEGRERGKEERKRRKSLNLALM